MKRSTIFIIVGVVVALCSCLASLGFMLTGGGGGIFSSTPAIPDGKIGGKCIGGTDCIDDAECQYGECYEECKAQPCWPCQNVNDIPRKRTYWCDYAECPQKCEEEKEEKTAMKSFIEEERERMKEKAEQKKIEEAEKAAAAKLAEQQAAAKTAEMKQLCSCKPTPSDRNEEWYKKHPICAKGVHGADGSDYQKWCYTRGGEQCTSGEKSVHSKLRGMTWKYCE